MVTGDACFGLPTCLVIVVKEFFSKWFFLYCITLCTFFSLCLRRNLDVFWDQVKFKQDSLRINITRRRGEGKKTWRNTGFQFNFLESGKYGILSVAGKEFNGDSYRASREAVTGRLYVKPRNRVNMLRFENDDKDTRQGQYSASCSHGTLDNRRERKRFKGDMTLHYHARSIFSVSTARRCVSFLCS